MANDDDDGPFVELGASLGTPAGLNLHLGYWGSSHAPVLARVSGMFWGERLNGAQFDLGFAFNVNGTFKQEFSSVFDAATLGDKALVGLGIMYGFNVYGFMLRGGLIAAFGDFAPLQLVAQIGFAPLL